MASDKHIAMQAARDRQSLIDEVAGLGNLIRSLSGQMEELINNFNKSQPIPKPTKPIPQPDPKRIPGTATKRKG